MRSNLISFSSYSDGCEGQQWSISVFAHLVRQVNVARLNGYYQNVRSLTYLKTAGKLIHNLFNYLIIFCQAGHGKSELDGEFTHPKSAIRREVQRLGAVGPEESNSSTGLAGANAIVGFLENHELFSPQFELKERKPDRRGYTMKRRYAKKADLNQKFGNIRNKLIELNDLLFQLKLNRLVDHENGI